MSEHIERLQKGQSSQTGMIAWFTNNSVAANLLMIAIVVAGIFSAVTIKKKMFPDFDINTVQVSVVYPGAGPDDVEQSVVLKLEEAVSDVTGIKKVVAVAREGYGRLNIEIETGYSIDDLYDDIKVSIEGLSNLPTDAENPIITKLEPENQVLFVSLFGSVDQLSLQRIAQQIQEELLNLPEVTKTNLIGEDALEISIEVSEQTLRQYGLTFDEVANIIRASSIDVAGGSIKTDDGDIVVKTRGQAYKGFDFSDFIIRTNADGSRLRLGDIATIRDGFVEDEGVVRFNGQRSVAIEIVSEGDQNDIAASRAINAFIDQRKESLPQGVEIKTWLDSTYYLEGRLDMMLENMLYGALLVFLLLSLFLRMRVAFWVVVGIPVCFLGALWLMPNGVMPVSINMLSLFGFILVLGVVVDDAIIIGESVYTQISRHGHTTDNVIAGVKRVVVPATFGVLTTMAAFMPVLLVEGQAAPFFSAIGLVVIFCLVFSLVESKLILPAHLAHMKRVDPSQTSGGHVITRIQNRFDRLLQRFISGQLKRSLNWALTHRYITLCGFVGVLILTVGLAMSPWIRFVFFPKLPSDFIRVSMTMHTGSSLDERNDALQRIEQAIITLDKEYSVKGKTEGQALLDSMMLWSRGDTEGMIFAELTKSEDRQLDANQVAEKWREYVGEIPSVQKIDFSSSTNAGGSKPIYFRLSGSDYPQLQRAAAELEARLKSYSGVFDIETTTEAATDEIVLSVRPEAEALGLNLATLGNQIRQGFYGEEVQKVQRGKEEVKVMLRYPREERNDLTDLDRVRIRTANGSEVPFQQVAFIEAGEGTSFIRRTNGQRSIAVIGDIDTETMEPDTIISDIEKEFLPGLYARYPEVSSGREGASLEEAKTMSQLGGLSLMALLMIYVLIAIPLRSYLQPLIIMAIIPFGLIGAVFGHLILGLNFSLLSVFGLIALSGVLVNDSLILVDFINQGKARGMTTFEAALSAGQERFRAIILTSLTTFLGLVPITLETSLQAQIVIPMAVSLGFGILFATVITLFLTPALYLMAGDIKKGLRWVWTGRTTQRELV